MKDEIIITTQAGKEIRISKWGYWDDGCWGDIKNLYGKLKDESDVLQSKI